MQELRALFLEFQERWSLDKVKNMTLEEYTGIGGANRDDFTYWIEYKLDLLNKYDRNPTKFGIWKNDNEEKQTNRASYNGDYGWFNSLKEKTPQQAFEKMKSYIVRLIILSQGNHLDEIDEIVNIEKLIGDVCAWKIAFCYQNINDMRILCIFSKNILQNIAKGESLGENLSTAQIYQKLLGDKTYTLEMMIEEKFTPLWKKYNNQKQKMQESNNSSQNNLQDSKKNQIPLNQILYGPPGTGKTYQTIDRALEILESYGQIESMCDNRNKRKKIFDEYCKNGQIAFITFHQSFSYEEFVEGIKPAIANEDGEEDSKNIAYKLKSGIFKDICERARKNLEDSKKGLKQLQEEYNTESLVESFMSYIGEQIEDDQNLSLDYKNWHITKTYDDVAPYKLYGTDKRWLRLEKPERKTPEFISIAIILKYYGEYKKDPNNLKIPSPKANKYPNSTHSKSNLYMAFFKKLQEFETKSQKQDLESVQKISLKPYILIIDEINRGNISKILGELITLIEPSKRIGEDEALEVTLPYSQESFGVPNNLYIIGTMNTADRSIALLDTALRRRFEFIEMMPQPNLLQDCAGVNLQELLKTINHRIEFLLDREHTIGHAYFIGVETLEKLQAVFAKKIIPLLQEYFYEDYAKIDAVLNGNGMIKVDEEIRFSKLFNSKFNYFDNGKSVYQITDSDEWKLWQFVKIYDEKKAKELEESLKKDSKIEPTIKENDEN